LGGKIHGHHVKPQYHEGTPSGDVQEIEAPYRQGITNEFRNRWGYKPNPRPTDQESDEVQEEVYDKYPLPPFDENGQSTRKSLPSNNNGLVQKISTATGLTGTALIIYMVVSEGSRLFPLRNIVPIP
jgi:hypothetical protein